MIMMQKNIPYDHHSEINVLSILYPACPELSCAQLTDYGTGESIVDRKLTN